MDMHSIQRAKFHNSSASGRGAEEGAPLLSGFQLSSCVPSPSLSEWLPGGGSRALPQARLLASDGVQTAGGTGNDTERGTLDRVCAPRFLPQRELRFVRQTSPVGRASPGQTTGTPSSGLLRAPSAAGPGVPQGPLWVSPITRPPWQ